MRSPPDRLPLGLALLVSLGLHMILLLPGSSNSPLHVGSDSLLGEGQALVLHAVRPVPPLRPDAPPSGASDPKAPKPGTPRPDHRGYHSADRLTHLPRPLQEVDLDLPESRLLTNPGKLLLTLWIDAEGRVVSFQVDAPNLQEEYTTAVAETFSALRFSPGEILGRKVASILKLEISHKAPAGTSP
jgi:hypothetical protein